LLKLSFQFNKISKAAYRNENKSSYINGSVRERNCSKIQSLEPRTCQKDRTNRDPACATLSKHKFHKSLYRTNLFLYIDFKQFIFINQRSSTKNIKTNIGVHILGHKH